MMRVYSSLVFTLFLLFSQGARSQDKGAAEAKAFFKGKTITWQIGSTPGASTGLLARLAAPYWEKYTGARIIVQNRPGGSEIAMFNFLNKRGKRDALTAVGILLPHSSLAGSSVDQG
jgi:tripartite-type tricarboxylate transporter receptor subunit TctC